MRIAVLALSLAAAPAAVDTLGMDELFTFANIRRWDEVEDVRWIARACLPSELTPVLAPDEQIDRTRERMYAQQASTETGA